MFTPVGLDHVVLRVRDQAVSQKFYMSVLGCSLEHVNEAIGLVHLRFGQQLIDLFAATPDARPGDSGTGMDHFCLSIECDDLPGLAKHLREANVEVLGDIAQRRGAYGTGPSLYIRDPDGFQIELKVKPRR
jgi:glyoxylase I family protein